MDTPVKPFGLHQVVLTPTTGSPVALPVDRVLKFKERTINGELSGSDSIAAVASFARAVDWELEAGGLPLEAYALMTGRTMTTSGSTPNTIKTLEGAGGDRFPYFKIEGRSLGVEDDDVHIVIYKAKVLDGLEGSFQDGQFLVSGVKGTGVNGSTGKAWAFVNNETAAAIAES